MTKADIVDSLATELEMPKRQVGKIVDMVLDEITAALEAGDNVQLIPFERFVMREREARTRGGMRHAVLEAHDPATGKITVARLRKTFSLSAQEVAGIAGVTARAMQNAPRSTRTKTQTRLERFERGMVRLRRMLDGDMSLVRIWLRTPHPDLGGRTPISYLKEGNLDVVDILVGDGETGQTA